MSLLDEFEAESLYAREQWYIHELVEVDAEGVVGVCATERLAESPLVRAQKAWPAQPRHVPGMVMIQITGTLGNLHAVFGLGLRMSEGWVGFGTNIHEARFKGMARIGPPLRCALSVERSRKVRGALFVTYAFRYEQEGKLIYRSKQTASWLPPGTRNQAQA